MAAAQTSSALEFPLIIIGGGISGLATAYYCQQLGLEPLVLESSALPGGLIQSVQRDGFLAEAGPNGFLVSELEPILSLARALGLGEVLITANPQQKRRYIFMRDVHGQGRLHAVPFSPPALLRSRLLSARGKMRLFAEPFIAPLGTPESAYDESLANFTRRRFGDEALQRLIDPMVTGIYAGDPEQLSAHASFPKIKELEWQYGSLIKGAMRTRRQGTKPQLYSLQHGLNGITGRLADHLGPKRLWLGCRVVALNTKPNHFEVVLEQRGQQVAIRTPKLVLATSPGAAASLLTTNAPRIADALLAFRAASIVSVSLGWRESDIPQPLDGYGFLVPSQEQLHLLGSIWSSCLFAGRAPAGRALMTCMLGGVRHPEIIDWSDAKLMQTLMDDLHTTMGISVAPHFKSIHRWRHAIPQYQIGHRHKVVQLESLRQTLPGLYFTGNYIDGISVAHCVARAQTLAGSICAPSSEGIDITSHPTSIA